MTLVDTSVWVDHFCRGQPALVRLLEGDSVECHPFVIGELACGNLKNRAEILELLQRLPQTPVAEHGDVLAMVERCGLMGAGIGWIDGHLLASAMIARTSIWTIDRRLHAVARKLGVPALP
jgi:predicted nucleic acid-binding protein